ncbi:MAG TPA: biopolymer transporter ExbD [Phycisphaerae bacterium]|nr:biopolymer transporter ExbD [Phycisphaerales bacterium]HRX87372.1 biopolymer transporter ExbD [Phycisphaerae bacterium]
MQYRLRTRRDAYRGAQWKRGSLRQGRRPLTLNLAPMIDVTFLLLIFFSVTTTFKRAEGFFSAKLPQDAGRPTVALPITPVIVRVQQYGPNPGDYRLRLDNFLNAPATFDELSEFLANVQNNPGFDADTPVVIAAEPDVAWDHVVGCWNAAVRAGCKNISFGR